MRPETLIPRNPGVANKITFPGGYDLKDLAFFIGLGAFIAAVFLGPILIVYENHEKYTLVYQVITAVLLWVAGTIGLIKRWFGRESAWRIVIHIMGFTFRKKRHVFYTLEEVNLNEKPKKIKNNREVEKSKETKKRLTNKTSKTKDKEEVKNK